MDMLDMKDSLLKLDPGVSPGFGGLRNEHLRCLAETWEQQDMALLDSFGQASWHQIFPDPRSPQAGGCQEQGTPE